MTLYIDLEWTPSLIGFLEDLQQTGTGKRGREYAEAGAVRQISATPDGLAVRAAVQGSIARPYLTALHLEGDHYLVTECSCPVGEDCKHGYALALTLAGGAYRNGSKYQLQLKRLLPPAWRDYAWNPAARLFEGIQELFVRVSEPAPDAAPPPKLTKQQVAAKKLNEGKKPKPASGPLPLPPPAPARPWWERLMAAATDQARERILLEVCEKRIGTMRYQYPYGLLTTLKGLKNNAAILMKLEAELIDQARSEGRPLRPPEPEYLAFRDSPMVREAFHAHQQAQYQGYLREWVERAAPPPLAVGTQECTLELNWKLMPVASGIFILAFELLITTGKMNRRPRKPQGIRQLAGDLAFGKRTTTPLMREVVEWLGTNYQITNQYQYDGPPWGDKGIIPVDSVLGWIGAWGGREVLRWDNGATVGFDPRPARLGIERGPGGEDLWIVEYPADPGAGAAAPPAIQPLAEAAVFCDGGTATVNLPYSDYGYSSQPRKPAQFYVRRGATILPLDACGMDPLALGAARALRQAPVELLLKKPQGMRLLRRLVRERPGEGAAGGRPGLVRAVSVQPVIELKSLRQEWIAVAAWGRTAGGRVFLRDAQGDWLAAPREVADGVASPFAMGGETGLAALNEPEKSADGNPQSEGEADEDVRAPSALIELPRMAELEPLEGWLRTLIPPQTAPLNHGQDRVSWRWPATAQSVAALLRRWAERPPGPNYLGNAEFLKLITPAARPGLRISVEPAGVDWLAVSVEMEKELERLGAREIRALLAANPDALVRLPNGRLYQRQGLEDYERELAAIEEAGLTPGRRGQRLHALHLAGESGQRLIELGGADERLAELARGAAGLLKKFRGVPAADIAPETAAHLRPYQRAGADFVAWACRTFGGALLADDMGLGKTLEVLAALTALKKDAKKHQPSLVICPASVAHNWQREAHHFAPGLKTLVIERGAGRKAMWERFGEFDLVIKNYALTRRDAEVIRKYEWLMVCVDEAQAIKNPASDIAAVVKSIPARYRVALTGTPIENRLGDLVSIMEFAAPGFLPALEAGEEETARRLRAWLRPVLLRRLKREVAPELPERIEERIDCAMTENQRLAYLAEVRRTREMLRGFKGERVAGPGRIQILAALTRLRQLCCDPALVALKDLGSGKVEELMGLLPPILEGGNKVLVFSQFVRMLHRLEERMKAAGMPIFMLTGQTKPADRLALVDRFERETAPSVFLISLKAGGTGLNLVSAAHVVLFDPWWNPAVEAQAIDRTHRIGQDKTVLAFRLVTEGTIEERILELQEKKRGLVQNVLEEDAFNRTLTREDFEFLLKE